jgi:hypothetical protein
MLVLGKQGYPYYYWSFRAVRLKRVIVSYYYGGA